VHCISTRALLEACTNKCSKYHYTCYHIVTAKIKKQKHTNALLPAMILRFIQESLNVIPQTCRTWNRIATFGKKFDSNRRGWKRDWQSTRSRHRFEDSIFGRWRFLNRFDRSIEIVSNMQINNMHPACFKHPTVKPYSVHYIKNSSARNFLWPTQTCDEADEHQAHEE